LYNSLYQYDQASNSWTQKASIPANGRCDATGTNIGNYGYIGTGDDLNHAFYKDWWQYDPSTDHWTRKADAPGAGVFGRSMASSFSIGQYGFIACGEIFATAYVNDLWMYVPVYDVWVKKASLPASARIYATGFNYGSYGALTCGQLGNNYFNDFWYYDLNSNAWTSGLSMGGAARSKAVGFTINGAPYVGTGESLSADWNNDFWYLTYVFF
jgi:N-acetylneuraminic acid mutarotase